MDKIYISHRGNLVGRNIPLENKPDYIDMAISSDFDVEVDVWVKDDKLYLGHDFPTTEISLEWLSVRSGKLWIHCKNTEAVSYFFKINKGTSTEEGTFNYFWHQDDLVTLTSKGYVWAYPGSQPIQDSISVLPEKFNDMVDGCIGICSDFILRYRK